MTPSDPTADTLPPIAETYIPSAPKLPSEFAATERPSPLDAVAERLGDLSDALHDPEGLVHRLLASIEERAETRASERHRQLMETVGHISNQLVELTQVVAKLVPEQARHAAELKLIKTAPKRKRGSRPSAAE